MIILWMVLGVWSYYSVWHWIIASVGEYYSGSLRKYYRKRYGMYFGSLTVFFHLLVWGPVLPLVLVAKAVYGVFKR